MTAPEIDVKTLALALSHVEQRTLLTMTEPGPQAMADAKAIAAEYARLRQAAHLEADHG